MLYTHTDLKKRGLSAYQIKKAVNQKELYRLESGLYSTDPDPTPLAQVVKKYDHGIITLQNAYYYYGLLKQEPAFFCLATVQKARKIKNHQIRQIFMTDRLYPIGSCKMTYHNITFMTYDLERLLIELIRYKSQLSLEEYEEIWHNYQRVKRLLNPKKLEQYLSYFKDKKIETHLAAFYQSDTEKRNL